jgi:hypothetical protein
MLIAVFWVEDLGESAFGAAWADAARNNVPSAAERTDRGKGESRMRKLRMRILKEKGTKHYRGELHLRSTGVLTVLEEMSNSERQPG